MRRSSWPRATRSLRWSSRPGGRAAEAKEPLVRGSRAASRPAHRSGSSSATSGSAPRCAAGARARRHESHGRAARRRALRAASAGPSVARERRGVLDGHRHALAGRRVGDVYGVAEQRRARGRVARRVAARAACRGARPGARAGRPANSGERRAIAASLSASEPRAEQLLLVAAAPAPPGRRGRRPAAPPACRPPGAARCAWRPRRRPAARPRSK